MDRTQKVFTGGMLALVVTMWAWMAVGAWPTGALWYRAEMGDQMAITEMMKRAMLTSHDTSAIAYWSERRRRMTPTEALFLHPDERKFMRYFLQGMGYETPLSDLMIK